MLLIYWDNRVSASRHSSQAEWMRTCLSWLPGGLQAWMPLGAHGDAVSRGSGTAEAHMVQEPRHRMAGTAEAHMAWEPAARRAGRGRLCTRQPCGWKAGEWWSKPACGCFVLETAFFFLFFYVFLSVPNMGLNHQRFWSTHRSCSQARSLVITLWEIPHSLISYGRGPASSINNGTAQFVSD